MAYRTAISSMSIDNGCYYCGGVADTWDHVVPRALGGLGDIENLVPCCRSCNSRKGSKPLHKFRQHLRNKGLPADFDTPSPYTIPGILTDDCFRSDDGKIIIPLSEYFNRKYFNEK